MAQIFLSYAMRDEALAKDIELRLKNKGHVFMYSVGSLPIGKWREKLLKALRGAEVVVPLLSENGLASNFVSSEIGGARVYDEFKGILVLPVIVGADFKVPLFVSDYHCYHLPSNHTGDIDDLVANINDAISQHISDTPKYPKIFISHRHKDEAIAESLVELLESAFYIEKDDIRCTSVQPYTLPSGERTSEKLRKEISNARVVIGLLTPDTTGSKYVLAELGAAWGCDVPTFPLMARGATYEHIPEPLNERHCLSIGRESDCLQLIDDLARATSLRRREGVSGRVAKDAKRLCEVANDQ
jgi:hypothetical protein